MIDFEFLSLPLAQRLTSTLAHFVWQGFSVMLACGLFLRVTRQSQARMRYAALLIGMIVIVLCPVLTFQLQSHSLTEKVLPAEAAGHHLPVNNLRNAPSRDAYSQLQPLLLGAWIAGVLLLSLRLAIGACSLQYLRRGSKPVPSDLADRFEWLGRRLGVRARRTVYLSHKVQEALVVGFVRPAILLPVSWVSELPAETLEAIVAHELAHIRRWDLWVNLMQRAIETLLFYHPAVWWISRQIRIERELCCDELAVAATGNRVVYATALELAARQRIAARQPALAAALRGESRMSLLRRVRNVLEVQPRRPRASWLPLFLLLAIGAAVFTMAVTGGLFADSASVLAQEEERERDEPRDEPRDGDRDRPRTERDGDRESPEGRARREDQRDRDRESPEARRDREPRRDGDRPDARRDGDRRPPVRRDGDGREPVARDRDQPRRPGEREVPRRDGDGREDALIRLLMELRRDVASLRQEVRELRERSDYQMRAQVDRQRREQAGERERQERARAEYQQRERKNIENRDADARRATARERYEVIKRQRAIEEEERAASRKREEDRRERDDDDDDDDDERERDSDDDERESDDKDED